VSSLGKAQALKLASEMGALAEQFPRLLVGSANDLTHNTNKGKGGRSAWLFT